MTVLHLHTHTHTIMGDCVVKKNQVSTPLPCWELLKQVKLSSLSNQNPTPTETNEKGKKSAPSETS